MGETALTGGFSLLWSDAIMVKNMAFTKEFIDEMTKAQDMFVWEAPSWEYVERGPRWFLWMSLVALVLAAYAIYTANYLFAFIILLTGLILVFAANEKPRKVLVQIGNNGIVYDGKLHMFDKIHDFAILYHPPHLRVLYVEPSAAFAPRLRISLEDEDPVAIRNHLRKFVEEDLDLQEEHVSDIFGRLLKL